MQNSTDANPKRPEPPKKPKKPRADFPLYAHATRRWAKRINGKIHYFGPWDDPKGALVKFLEERDDLYAGRTPRVQRDGLTVKDLVNEFLNSKRLLVDAGEMHPRSWRDYYVTCERLITEFGKSRLVYDLAAGDFDRYKARFAKARSPVTVGSEVNRVRVIFNWAWTDGHIETPIRYGSAFKRVSKKIVRMERAKKGLRMFEAEELRRVLDAAAMPMKAMVMLGINAGLGNTDISSLQTSHLDGAWLNYPRPKTGIGRRCPIWPETAALIRQAIAKRPAAKRDEDALCVFLTIRGERCVRIQGNGDNMGVKVDAVTREFSELLKTLKMKRSGLNFYALRHTFETIAGASRDQVAVDWVMGHSDPSMGAVYRERVDDDRLQAVVDVVRAWLWPVPPANQTDHS